MTINILAETKRAEFLDWIDNNKDKIIEYLKLEEEDLLREIFENPEWVEDKEHRQVPWEKY